MAKSKFSKKQIAGTLLLSSAAIGAVASGTASANAFTDFFKNGLGKTGEIVKSGVNMVFGSKISNKLDGHEISVGTVTWGVGCLLVYGLYRAIKSGLNHYFIKNNKKEESNKIKNDDEGNNKELNSNIKGENNNNQGSNEEEEKNKIKSNTITQIDTTANDENKNKDNETTKPPISNNYKK